MIECLVSDVDLTLTDAKGQISIKVIAKIRDIEALGVTIGLASGMSLASLMKLRGYIGCTGPIIAENGAAVEYNGALKILGNGKIVREVFMKVMEEFRLEEPLSLKCRYVDISFERSLEKGPLLQLISCYPKVKFLDSGVAYHITDTNVDKGTGLKSAADLMKINLSKIAAIGDSETDEPLLEAAGTGIALSNAPETLKKKADHVTEKPYYEGFLEALEILRQQFHVNQS